MRNRKTCASSLKVFLLLFVWLLGLTEIACNSDDTLSEIKEKGTLVVLMRNSPTIYYEGPEGPKGFEYDLISAFARSLGVKPEIKIYDSITALLSAVQAGEGDLASGAITRTADREETYVFGPDYYTVRQVVVYRRGTKHPENVEELSDYEIEIISGSSYEERLTALKMDYPNLSWTVTDEYSTEQLLQRVWRGQLECTIADENIAAVNRRYFPGLNIAFPISGENHLAWVINPSKPSLAGELKKWFKKFKSEGKLEELETKYYSYTNLYDYVDLREFLKRIDWRLPRYRAWFEEAAKKYDLPWTLLAAQAYQESHWNTRATSPTGVKGMMMLTQNTAQSLGVTNRLDPYQSIMGGARYLSRMVKQVPDSVQERDRLKFALAAYNVGMGHVRDAQVLAEKLGYDSTRWIDLKEVLPLLTQQKYYSQLKHGYARGTEPVRYVSRIRNYQNILEQKLLNSQ